MTGADVMFHELLELRTRPRPRASPPPPRHGYRRLQRESWPLRRIVVVLFFIGSTGAAIYPTAAAWFSDRIHATELSGYVESVEGLPPAERTAMLDAARAYNDRLSTGPIVDPYSLGIDGLPEDLADDVDRYLETLAIGVDGMMGRIRIDRIGVSLPIYHGTGERSLSQGVGHLYGTALPVGGPGTHAVLTSHSGLLNAALFTHLEELEVGDVFSVTVLDETLTYEVDQIRTVTPEKTEGLQAVAGEDYITLVTCTPTGVNTHRLLVRGHRVATPANADQGRTAIANDTGDPGFPWWALLFAVAVIGSIAISRLMVRRSAHSRRPEPAPGPRRRGSA